jgi:hypothetical protein
LVVASTTAADDDDVVARAGIDAVVAIVAIEKALTVKARQRILLRTRQNARFRIPRNANSM